MSDTKKCPRCGGTSGAWTRARVSGFVTRHVDWDGESVHSDTDEMREKVRRTATCVDCGKRVPNPEEDSQ